MKILCEYDLTAGGWRVSIPGFPFESKPLSSTQTIAVMDYWGQLAAVATAQGWTEEQILQRWAEFHKGSFKPKAPPKRNATPADLTFEALFGGKS